MENNSELIIYTTEDGLTKVDVTFEDETVWLTQEQMAELFQRDKSTISRHIAKIFKDGELDRSSTVAYFATVQTEDVWLFS
ncbi:MAG: death-on-curing protein [Lachnospiraceae bacterium]|nr:death-on-curing protein [Lachnospiraceae bacterium]